MMRRRPKVRTFKQLTTIEQTLRLLFPEGMREGVDVTIRFEIGYERFGAYDTWAHGFVVEAGKHRVSARHLDDAIKQLKYAVEREAANAGD